MDYDKIVSNEFSYIFHNELNEWILNTVKNIKGKIILGHIRSKKEYFILYNNKKISTFNYEKFCIENAYDL